MLEFEVHDMTCNHCVTSITKAIMSVAPNATVRADLEAHRVTVTGSPDQDAVLTAITDTGFTARPVQG